MEEWNFAVGRRSGKWLSEGAVPGAFQQDSYVGGSSNCEAIGMSIAMRLLSSFSTWIGTVAAVLLSLGTATAANLEFLPDGETVIVENGTRFILVDPNQDLQFTVQAVGAESPSGFQLNFAASTDDLSIDAWVTSPKWAVVFDSSLQLSTGDTFVSAASLGANQMPIALGAFRARAPSLGDFQLSVSGASGPFATGLVGASGDIAIADFGEITIRALPGPPLKAGDFNRDGTVNLDDYSEWRTAFGSSVQLLADGNDDGIVGAADYTIWRDAAEVASASVAGSEIQPALGRIVSVPEASSGALALVGVLTYLARRRSMLPYTRLRGDRSALT